MRYFFSASISKNNVDYVTKEKLSVLTQTFVLSSDKRI